MPGQAPSFGLLNASGWDSNIKLVKPLLPRGVPNGIVRVESPGIRMITQLCSAKARIKLHDSMTLDP